MVGDLKLAGSIIGIGLGEVLPDSVARERLDRLTTVIGSEEWAASELLKVGDLAARLHHRGRQGGRHARITRQ